MIHVSGIKPGYQDERDTLTSSCMAMCTGDTVEKKSSALEWCIRFKLGANVSVGSLRKEAHLYKLSSGLQWCDYPVAQCPIVVAKCSSPWRVLITHHAMPQQAQGIRCVLLDQSGLRVRRLLGLLLGLLLRRRLRVRRLRLLLRLRLSARGKLLCTISYASRAQKMQCTLS